MYLKAQEREVIIMANALNYKLSGFIPQILKILHTNVN
jgi:hypothetical protein